MVTDYSAPFLILSTNNDGLGFEGPDEWDDYRSYGLLAKLNIDSFGIMISLDSLTNRSKENFKRSDELSMGAFFTPDWNTDYLPLLNVGFFIQFYSNFGSYYLQQNFHDLFNVPRALPDIYDRTLVIPSLYAQGLYNLPFFEPILFDMSSLLSWEALQFQTGIHLQSFNQGRMAQIGIIYEYNLFSKDHLTADVNKAETGFWFSTGIEVASFIIEKKINLNTFQSQGLISFTLHQTNSSEQSPVFHTSFGTYVNLTTNAVPGFSVKIEYPIPVLNQQLSFISVIENGDEYIKNQENNLIRASHFLLGLDYHFLPITNGLQIIPYLGMFNGIRTEKEVTLNEYRAQALSNKINYQWGTNLGIKIKGIKLLADYYGIDLSLNWRFYVYDDMASNIPAPPDWGQPMLRLLLSY